MLTMRTFGTICQECKRFVPLGEIESEDSAPHSTLHHSLREIAWQSDWVVCENPKCKSRTFCVLDQTVFQA